RFVRRFSKTILIWRRFAQRPVQGKLHNAMITQCNHNVLSDEPSIAALGQDPNSDHYYEYASDILLTVLSHYAGDGSTERLLLDLSQPFRLQLDTTVSGRSSSNLASSPKTLSISG